MSDGYADRLTYYSALTEWMAKGGATPEQAVELITKLHDYEKFDYTPESISDMVYGDFQALLEGRKTRNRPIQKEVESFVTSVTAGYGSVTISLLDCYNSLHLKTAEEKTAARMAIKRLVSKGVLESSGGKSGVYRSVDRSATQMDYLNANGEPFRIGLPLSIERMATLYPSNIVIIAGSSNSGKTAFLLNIVKGNMKNYPIYYLNSEMGETELRLRLSLFEDTPLNGWSAKFYERASNYQDLVTGEKAIFIIDYLEVSKDFYEVAGIISEIHQKLKEGVCIIALQKKSGYDIGRGGEGTLEKARLYLSLDRDSDSNICKIVKAKAWGEHGDNPNGKVTRYKLVKGSKIIQKGEWA